MTNLSPEQIADVTKMAKDLISTLPPEAQKEVLLPVMKSVGKGFSSVFDILFYFPNSLSQLLNNKLRIQAQELERITSPKLERLKNENNYTEEKIELAYKALESSKYQLNSDILREYYSQLIANSFNKNKVDTITPNFANILSNFSESEAVFLRKLVSSKSFENAFAFGIIRLEDDQGAGIDIQSGLVPWDDGNLTTNQLEIDTLVSYGILDIRGMLDLPKRYEQIENSNMFNMYKNGTYTSSFDNKKFTNVYLIKKSIYLTELGKLFVDVAVPQ